MIFQNVIRIQNENLYITETLDSIDKTFILQVDVLKYKYTPLFYRIILSNGEISMFKFKMEVRVER